MTNPENEKLVKYLVVLDKPGRRSSSQPDARWGELLHPSPSENPAKAEEGFRIVLFGSWDFGYLVLETLKAMERRFPGRLTLAGLATDNPLNPDARISVKKRVWSLLDLPHRVVNETSMIDAGLSHGMPVYTGEIKVASFHELLRTWNPHAILSCVFGQVIDATIIGLPPYGIYNFHPSDLTRNQGAGPAPYDDLAQREAATTVWSIHQVSERIDSGPVIGQSPEITVRDAGGRLPTDPLAVYQKVGEALAPLTICLVRELCRRFTVGQPGAIDHIDFPALVPESIKRKLLLPIADAHPSALLPVPDLSLLH